MKKGLGRIPKSLSWLSEPATNVTTAEKIKSTQKGLKSGLTRATFIVNQELNNKLKALAYWERVTVKEVIHEALTKYFEGKNVKPIPKKEKLI